MTWSRTLSLRSDLTLTRSFMLLVMSFDFFPTLFFLQIEEVHMPHKYKKKVLKQTYIRIKQDLLTVADPDQMFGPIFFLHII